MDGRALSLVRDARGGETSDRSGMSRQAVTRPATRACCSRWIFHDASIRNLIEGTAGSEAWRVIVREQLAMQSLLQH